MEGAARVFAGEFCRSTCLEHNDSSSAVLTISGARCRQVFIAGALTEVTDCGGVLRCRLSDPTGAFDLEIVKDGKTGLADSIRKVTVPAFLTVIGRARLRRNASPATLIRPESVQIVDRSVRDTWVIRTADCTLQRIGILVSVLNGHQQDPHMREVIDHYHTTLSDLSDLVSMVEAALSVTRPVPAAAAEPQQDAREIVIGIIRDLQGARGIAIDEVIAQAGLRAVPKDRAQEAINELIQKDECYQPRKGAVRLL
jgi:RPA family protein